MPQPEDLPEPDEYDNYSVAMPAFDRLHPTHSSAIVKAQARLDARLAQGDQGPRPWQRLDDALQTTYAAFDALDRGDGHDVKVSLVLIAALVRPVWQQLADEIGGMEADCDA